MKCPSCGKENSDQTAYCAACGAPLSPAPQQPDYQQAAPQQPVYQQPVYQQPAPAPQKKSKKGCGIAAGIVAAVVVVVVIIIAALGGGDDVDSGEAGNGNNSTPPASAQTGGDQIQQGKGTLGDYTIEIKDATLTEDYAGDPALVVTYGFTNNSDTEQSFMVAVSDRAYQDGVQLQTTISAVGSDIDTSTQMSNIKPGASIDVTAIYGLSNTTSDVEVELSELISLSDAKVVKTFSIAQ